MAYNEVPDEIGPGFDTDKSHYSTESSWKIVFINYRGAEYVVDSEENSVILGFSINESLFESNVITGDIKIFDGAGLDERIPLVGQEKVRIELKNNLLGGSGWNAEYTIIKRSATVEDGPRKFYVLDFCSDEFIANLRNKVSKSYKSQLAGHIVSDIYESYIAPDQFVAKYKKLHYDEKGDSDGTFYGMHFVFPTVRPFKAINMVVKKSVASNVEMRGNQVNANFGRFLFYENKFGFYFKALSDLLHPLVTMTPAEVEDSPVESLEEQGQDSGQQDSATREKGKRIASPPVTTSVNIPVVSYVIRPGDHINMAPEQKEFSVIRYRLQSTFNVLNNLIEGMYSGRLLTYDPTTQRVGSINQSSATPYIPSGEDDKRFTNKLYKANHQVTYYEYDYWNQFSNFRHVGGGKNPLTNNHHYGVDKSEAFYKYVSTNFHHNEKMITRLLQNIMTDNNKGAISVDKQVERWLIQSYSQTRQMKNIITEITVPGDHNRVVGEIIELKYPSNYYPDKEHSFYSGYYLITKIQHVVTNNSYLTVMELAKDTLLTRLYRKYKVVDEYGEQGGDYSNIGDSEFENPKIGMDTEVVF
jgi:hypothetical protein